MSTVAPPRRPVPPPPAPPPPTRPDWWSQLPWRGAEAKAAPRDDLATCCLFLVSLAVALSLGRLFRGTTWLPYGVAAAALGHGMAWALRRIGAGLTAASVLSAFLSLLVAIELVVPQATTYLIPTPYTFQVLGQALTDAQASFRSAVPPVAPVPGFLAASVVGVCLCTFLADWAAFRMRTAFEACVPGLALFVFAAVLGAKSHRGIAVAGFAAASLAFLIVQRANLDGGQTAWFGGRDRGALPSLLATGAVLGAVAVVGALVLSPMVPGASSKALLSLKKGGGSGTGTRSTVSPLVDIQNRLRDFAYVEVFKVQAERPAYWRLTSLDQFDGSIWSSNERYAASRGQLAPADQVQGTELTQEVTVSGLSSIWLPAAYRPVAVGGARELSYSPGSASLITKKDTSDGLSYTITSIVPDVGPDELLRAPASAAATSDLGDDFDRYTEMRGTITQRVRRLAASLGEGKASPYAKALAIQGHLRSADFTYDLKAEPGHSGNAIDRFLFETQTGYCEQFAGSFAVLARLMGLPTRVAVGFQPGSNEDGTFTVQDKDAHAWPEVYFEGIGWIAFEPTPSAGNPQAVDYTGVPYTPSPPAAPDPATPSTEAPAPDPAAPDPAPAPQPNEPDPTIAEDPAADDGGSLWSDVLSVLRRSMAVWLPLLALAALTAGSAAFVAWERTRRRRLGGGSPEARVHMAWEESLQALATAGVRPRPAETVAELVLRLRLPAGGAALAGVERGTPANAAIARLGDAVMLTAYTGRNAAPATAEAAEEDRSVIVDACRASLGRWARLRSDLDPRPALTRLRRARASRRPPVPTID